MKDFSVKKLIVYLLFLLPVVVCGFVGRDKIENILISAVAIVYLLLLNDKYRVAYLLCFAYAIAYGIVSALNFLYATAVYHVLVLAPVAVYRFIVFGRAEKDKTTKRLHWGGWIACGVTVVLASVALFFLLNAIGDSQPLLDGVTLALSLVTAVLMLQNYAELWVFNLLSTVIYIAMWLVSFFVNGTGLAFAVMQTIVAIINVRGMVLWLKKEEK